METIKLKGAYIHHIEINGLSVEMGRDEPIGDFENALKKIIFDRNMVRARAYFIRI